MPIIRQLIQKGDPMVRVQLPTTVIQMLQEAAKKNKRRRQDQFIKSLTETFKQEQSYTKIFDKYRAGLKEFYKS